MPSVRRAIPMVRLSLFSGRSGGYRAGSFGRTFSSHGGSRGYPIVALSFQRDRNVDVGIIHVNQLDRNSGGAIWSRIENRDGRKVKSNLFPVFDTHCSIGTGICILNGQSKDYSLLARV